MDKSNSLPNDLDIICLIGGKCGSTTLNYTLKSSGFKMIEHIHSKLHFIKLFNHDGLLDLIKKCSSNKKLYIIDSYRTPIERKISSFFQHMHQKIPNYKNKNIEELINIFNTEYLNKIEEYHPLDSIMRELGSDSFNSFDFNKRYVKKEKGNLIFIKILFSDLKDWGEILSEIFNKKIIIQKKNLSQDKEYHLIYEEFKKKYKTTEYYLNNILRNDKYFKIYNTKEQQEKYIEKYMQSAI